MSEILRLDALQKLEILDTHPEIEFDQIVLIASQIANTPIGIISFIDGERQWFKAKVGLEISEISKKCSFCSHAILQDNIFVVEDASLDERFMNNPLVTGVPNVRFYAGIPILTEEQYPLGTLCILDSKPGKLSHTASSILTILKTNVELLLQLRLKNKEIQQVATRKEDAEWKLKIYDQQTESEEFGNFQVDLNSMSINCSNSFFEILTFMYGRSKIENTQTFKKLFPKFWSNLNRINDLENIEGLTLEQSYMVTIPGNKEAICFRFKGVFYQRIGIRSFDGLVQNISEKNIELMEKEGNVRFIKSMVDNMQGFVFRAIPSQNFKINFISHGVAKILGYEPDEFISEYGLIMNEVVAEDHKDFYLSTMKKAFINKESYHCSFKAQAKNGDIEYLTLHAHFVWDPALGEYIKEGFVISETKSKLEELALKSSLKLVEDQNKRLGNFSYIATHNLRSHSSNMRSILDFYSESESEQEKQELFSYLSHNVDKLEETIQNLNQIISTTKNTSLPTELLPLHLFIENAIEIVSSSISTTKALVKNLVQPSVMVLFNPAYLESVVLNFLTNAIKYRKYEQECLVEFKSYTTKEYLVLEISDNGIGIDLQKNGDKLFNFHKTFTNRPESHGIGLFLVKNQIEALHGKIEVKSKLDMGSTFSIFFKHPSKGVHINY